VREHPGQPQALQHLLLGMHQRTELRRGRLYAVTILRWGLSSSCETGYSCGVCRSPSEAPMTRALLTRLLPLLLVGSLLTGCGGESNEDPDTGTDAPDMMGDASEDTSPDSVPQDMIDPQTGRIATDLLALYLFNEDQSQVVFDRSNDGVPTDLYNRKPNRGTRLVNRNGYRFDYSSWEDSGLESFGP